MLTAFISPGKIDITAFTVFGAHSKPNTTNPIGFFGTGLKYAIAVLLREKHKVQLFIGQTEYEFYTTNKTFRDKTIEQVMLKKRRGLAAKWTYETLPFTLDLGRNWKLWQAFRELFTNTVDEGGAVYEHTLDPKPEETQIIVHGDDFHKIYKDRGKIFLNSVGHSTVGKPDIEVIKAPSEHVYWRGMRVHDLQLGTKALFTYNIWSDLDLTEDRTLKYTFMMHTRIVNWIVQCDDEQLIDACVGAKGPGVFEAALDWYHANVKPSATFNRVVSKRRKTGQYVAHGAGNYYTLYAPAPISAKPWGHIAAACIRESDWVAAVEVMINHQTELAKILNQASYEKPAPVVSIPADEDRLPAAETFADLEPAHTPPQVTAGDDIPF